MSADGTMAIVCSSTGILMEQNLVQGTGAAPLFANSDGTAPATTGAWSSIRDNILVAEHIEAADNAVALVWRSEVRVGNVTRNVFAVRFPDGRLMQCNCGGHTVTTCQFNKSNALVWDANLYTGSYQPDTFCGDASQSEWQAATGHDIGSLFGVDPLFVNATAREFMLRASSPAITTLGFRSFSLGGIGPRMPPPRFAPMKL